ncbi:MAG: flagellar motor protein MotA [SAR324 cluster bacterium]|uniref:Flagellar motor protein MotA n=1 Tax=SAR324 cluster bacterium TaxID=2024889 RepID=A0A2D6YMB4_9DELT|nr:flagellar motor protein MotA [SAR324 cluster bacterium]|tara:strand:+ start:140 stop:871 length:732 start_codon:yes stop_codon:yes gene_type:complete
MNSVLAQLTDGQSLLQVVLEGTLIGQLVLVSLLLLSSLSWAVIILKGLQFYRFQKDDQNFLLLFRESSLDQTYKQIESFPQSSLAYIFRKAYQEINQTYRRLQKPSSQHSEATVGLLNERLQRVMERSYNERYSYSEHRLNILASVSGASPYIGLFGTVLGVIDAFQGIGISGITSLAAVAPGISEALIATAAGLLAAIPALMAFNHYRNRARNLSSQMRDFTLELTNRIEWVLYEQLAQSGK